MSAKKTPTTNDASSYPKPAGVGPKPKPGSAAPASGRSPLVLIGAATAIVAVLALVAVIATSSTKKSGTDAAAGEAATREFAPVRLSGAALARQSDTGPDTSIGAKAPKLDGSSFHGEPVSIAPGSGPMIVMFVAHWCPHCQREVPLVAKWVTGDMVDGVSVRAVSTSASKDLPNYPPSSWLARENFTVPTMVDDEASTAANAFGLASFPFFVALDGSGNVVTRVSGEITQAQFSELASLAKGS